MRQEDMNMKLTVNSSMAKSLQKFLKRNFMILAALFLIVLALSVFDGRQFTVRHEAD